MATTPRRERRLEERGFATKREERQHRMSVRLAAATTAEEQLSAAYDWFRMAVTRDAAPEHRGRLMRDVAAYLAGQARAIQGGDGS